MQKRHRDITGMVQRAGLTLESITPSGSGHLRVMVKAGEASKTFFLSTSPGDFRADKNSESEIRRWARDQGIDQPAVGSVGDAQRDHSQLQPAILPRPPEPSLTPQPTIMPTPQRTSRNQLTHVEFYRLCEWMKATDLSDRFSYVEVARYAAQALKMNGVSAYSVQNAMATTGKTLAASPKATEPKDRVRVVARVLADLMRKIGEDIPPELANIVGSRPTLPSAEPGSESIF